jgi:dihydroneopterin aldolase
MRRLPAGCKPNGGAAKSRYNRAGFAADQWGVLVTDRIRLNDMIFYGYHGVLPEERTLGQRFVVSVELRTDLRSAGATDDLRQTVNYAEVYGIVRTIVTGEPRQLIEAVAEQIAQQVLAGYEAVESLTVSIRKPEVPMAGSVLGSSEVWIERDRT